MLIYIFDTILTVSESRNGHGETFLTLEVDFGQLIGAANTHTHTHTSAWSSAPSAGSSLAFKGTPTKSENFNILYKHMCGILS